MPLSQNLKWQRTIKSFDHSRSNLFRRFSSEQVSSLLQFLFFRAGHVTVTDGSGSIGSSGSSHFQSHLNCLKYHDGKTQQPVWWTENVFLEIKTTFSIIKLCKKLAPKWSFWVWITFVFVFVFAAVRANCTLRRRLLQQKSDYLGWKQFALKNDVSENRQNTGNEKTVAKLLQVFINQRFDLSATFRFIRGQGYASRQFSASISVLIQCWKLLSQLIQVLSCHIEKAFIRKLFLSFEPPERLKFVKICHFSQ